MAGAAARVADDEETAILAEIKERSVRLDFLDLRDRYEDRLSDFTRQAWPMVDATPYQSCWANDAICDHLEAVVSGHIPRLLINQPPRTGKPVDENEMVVERCRGRIRLADVQVGDCVLTHRGRFRRVTHVHIQGILPVVKIRTWSGRTVRSALDHPFLTAEGWKDAGCLKSGDILGVVAPMESFGKRTVSPEEARLLGYLIGDGTVGNNQQPGVTTGSRSVSSDVVACVSAMGWVTREKPNSRNSWHIVIKAHEGHSRGPTRSAWREWLIAHDLHGKSSYSKRVPAAIMTADKEIISEFVGAYWSCDGYITGRGTQPNGAARRDFVVGAASVSRDLLLDIQHLLLKLGINSNIRTKTLKIKTKKQGDSYTHYDLTLRRRDDVAKFAQSVRIVHEKRLKLIGHERRQDFDRALFPDPVVDVVADGTAACRCLTVEEDGSFTANDFAVKNTLQTSVCFPAWVWARRQISFLSGPQVRFLCGSYNAPLALNNANLSRRLLLSPFYQRYWGNRFMLRQDQNSKSNFSNTKNGARISTSVGGSLIGFGGDIVCFPYWQEVQTEFGPRKIGDLVEKRDRVRVWSLNLSTGELELQPVTGWHTNPGRRLVRIVLDDGSAIECTEDHQILTPDGYLPASSLRPGCRLASAPGRMFVPSADVARAQVQAEVRPTITPSDVADRLPAHPELSGQHRRSVFVSLRDLAHHIFRQVRRAVAKCAMHLAIGDVLRPRAIMEVRQCRVGAIPVLVPDLLSVWARAEKGRCDHLMAEPVDGLAADPHRDARISLVDDRRHDAFPDATATVGAHPREALDTTEIGNRVSPRCFDHGEPRFVDRIESVHEVPAATYCLSVHQNHNMVIHGVVSSLCCKNCVDDPHNLETEKKVETDADRKKVESWWKELSSTRLNDPKQTAIIVVMQRLHQKDLSGVILDSDEEWTHLCIPLEFDTRRRCVTVVLPQYDDPEPWSDPREEENELMWPERFGRAEVARLKERLGPYMSAGRLQQAPTPKGGGILKEDWWEVWGEEQARHYGLEWNRNLKEFPPMELVVGSIDTAYGKKEENDFSAMTVWGIWIDRNKNRRAMLMYGWQSRLPLHGVEVSPIAGEAKVQYRARQRAAWGLVETIADTCKRYKVERLLIEDKNRGRDVAEEIVKLNARERWGVQLVNPVGDKVSRAHSVVSMFTDRMIYAPVTSWSQVVIDNCSIFPKGEHDDLVDTVTQFLRWARESDLLLRGDEASAMLRDEERFRPRPRSVADTYGV